MTLSGGVPCKIGAVALPSQQHDERGLSRVRCKVVGHTGCHGSPITRCIPPVALMPELAYQ
jgi:hypothetical protein